MPGIRGQPESELLRPSGVEGSGLAYVQGTGTLESGVLVGDKYRIEARMGRGATADVYAAVHRVIGRRVAIKVVRADHPAREHVRRRFEREAQATGRIRSPYVGCVEDVGNLDDGRPYIVMQLYEGTTLEARLAQGPLPLAAGVDMACQLLDGLSAVHGAGLVHRDVKPGNIILEQRPSGAVHIVLVDFGVVKTLDGERELEVTKDGDLVGTPEYMAPEQIRAERELDARVDVYAAGAVLYEALTGHPPFDAPSMTEVLASVLRDPLRPPSERCRGVPRALDQVLLRAMAADPSQRYPSAEAMRAALDVVVAQQDWPTGNAAWRGATLLPQRPQLWLRPEDRHPGPTVLPRRQLRRLGPALVLLALSMLLVLLQYGPWDGTVAGLWLDQVQQASSEAGRTLLGRLAQLLPY